MSLSGSKDIQAEARETIQIQHPGQFEKAAARLERERMGVRRSEAHLYEVTNKAVAAPARTVKLPRTQTAEERGRP